MTQAELLKIISILEGPIPGRNATCKEILDRSVLYHKCAGSLLDEVLRLRKAITKYWNARAEHWADECNPAETELYETLNQ